MKVIAGFVFSLVIILAFGNDADAQFRNELPTGYSVTGPTVMLNKPDSHNEREFGLSSFRMGHSYQMSFGSFGGQMFNQNMYTNTMFMQFNEKMSGRLDVAFAHSPFGSALPGMNQTGQVFIRNAEFNYNINERMNISFHFQQNPGGMGYYGGPFGMDRYGYGPYSRHRFSPYSIY